MSDLSNIVDKATDAIVNRQTLSTNNLNDLAKIFYASANRIIEAIDKSAGLHREIVQQLPTQDIDDNTIYMVLDSSASGSDIYDEWMWIENAWEHIGSTRVDLSDYYNKTQVDTALSGKANVATSIAGYGITDAYTKTEVDTGLSGKASTSDIPTTLAGLSDDSTHRVVTDTEKSTWNGKQGALTFDNLPTKNSNNPVKSSGVRSYVINAFEGKTFTKTISSIAAGATANAFFGDAEIANYDISGIRYAYAYSGNYFLDIIGWDCPSTDQFTLYIRNNTGATRTNVEVKLFLTYTYNSYA